MKLIRVMRSLDTLLKCYHLLSPLEKLKLVKPDLLLLKATLFLIHLEIRNLKMFIQDPAGTIETF